MDCLSSRGNRVHWDFLGVRDEIVFNKFLILVHCMGEVLDFRSNSLSWFQSLCHWEMMVAKVPQLWSNKRLEATSQCGLNWWRGDCGCKVLYQVPDPLSLLILHASHQCHCLRFNPWKCVLRQGLGNQWLARARGPWKRGGEAEGVKKAKGGMLKGRFANWTWLFMFIFILAV